MKRKPSNLVRLGLNTLEDRLVPAPLPVLMVIANQDFYYQEYNDTRNSLQAKGVPVVVAATTATPSTPHPNSGQGTGSGVVTPTIALGSVNADDYSAIVFVGGWGSSMYQYAFSGNYAAPDNYYFNTLYNGDPIPGDGIIAPQKVAVNSLINEFLADDKPVAAICHGTTVLAWARVGGVSPIAGKNIVVPHTDGTPAMFYSGTTYSNGFAQGQYLQAKAHGAIVSAVGGQVGNPTTAADDVVVDGRIITAENQTSALMFGTVIAIEVIANNLPPTPIQGPGTVTIPEGVPGKIAQFTSTDPEGGPISWSLSGPNASKFTITSTGLLSSTVEFDGPATLPLTVVATDNASKETTYPVIVYDINLAPTVLALTGPTTLNVGEIGTFQLTGVSDVAADLATMKYDFWLTGETPAPSYGEGYVLDVDSFAWGTIGTRVVSGRTYDKDGGISETKTFTVTVVDAPPTPIAGPAVVTINEGGPAFVAQYSSTDPEGKPLSWFLQGPAPIPSLFNISSTGALSSKVELDGPFTGGVQVAVADVSGNTAVLDIIVNVQNAAPTAQALTGPAKLNVGEVGTFQLTGVSDVAADLATMKYDFWLTGETPAPSYNMAGEGDIITIQGTGFGNQSVHGRAYDKDGGISETKSFTFIVNAPPTPIVGPTSISIPEGVPGTLGVFSSTDPEGGPISWSVDAPNATKFNISSTGVLSSTVEFDGPTSLTVQITATDQGGAQALEYYIIKLSNVAPTVQALTGPTLLIQGETATFTPTGVSDIAADQKTMKYIHWKLVVPPPTTYDNAVSTPDATYMFTTPGTHTVYSRAIDKDGGISETKSLTVNVLAPPTVQSFTINDGSAQRSRITSLAVTFTQTVNLSYLQQPGAVLIVRSDGATLRRDPFLAFNFNVTIDTPNSVLIDDFANSPFVEHGSLADGRWKLTIPAWNYETSGNQLYRLFGDATGDATVDATDLSFLGVDFGTTGESPFDFNGDNTVDASDYGHFGTRFGMSI